MEGKEGTDGEGKGKRENKSDDKVRKKMEGMKNYDVEMQMSERR